MKRRTLLALGIGIGLCGVAAQAHHSIAAVYDDSRRMTIQGVVTQFQFVNPHPFVVMEVKEDNTGGAGGGGAQQWTLEMDNLRELVDIGVDDKTIRPGDRIVVTGSPARGQRQSLYIRKLERPADGFTYEQIGSRPSIGTAKSRPRE
jgi:hypothetical protein